VHELLLEGQGWAWVVVMSKRAASDNVQEEGGDGGVSALAVLLGCGGELV